MSSPSSGRICKTRSLKDAGAFDKAKRKRSQLDKLFNGSIHFVDVSFTTSNGTVSMATADTATAVEYAAKIAGVVSDYCSQYGPNSYNVNPNPIPFSVTLQGTSYTDADLQGWIQKIVASAPLVAPGDALVFLSPPGVVNTDSDPSQGYLGYHGLSGSTPYSFCNVLGSGLTLDDRADVYAVILSHEIAEMVVDPLAHPPNPEVCDSCAGNCAVDYRNFFDDKDNWLGQSAFPPAFPYAYFVEGIVTMADVKSCPAPVTSCSYAPPSSAPSPTPTPTPTPTPAPTPAPTPPTDPCVARIEKGVAEIKNGELAAGIADLIAGIECLFTQSVSDEVRKLLRDGQSLHGRLKALGEKIEAEI